MLSSCLLVSVWLAIGLLPVWLGRVASVAARQPVRFREFNRFDPGFSRSRWAAAWWLRVLRRSLG